MHYISYDLLETLVGPTIAENYNEIVAAIFVTAFFMSLLRKEHKKAKERKEREELQSKERPKRKGKKITKWYPTGWTFNEETQLWDPPDYLDETNLNRKPKEKRKINDNSDSV